MLAVAEVPVEEILSLRKEYRRELACQIVHDSWHERGFTRSFLLHADGVVVGYGSVGGAPREPKETVKELYVVPHARRSTLALFRLLVEESGARAVEAQTNDRLLLLVLLDRAKELTSEVVLFEDALPSAPESRGIPFRRLGDEERAGAFAHEHEPVGEYGLVLEGEVVASGGFATHYNPPYADLYLEVAPAHRRRGLGAYLVQELKRACRESGYVPAARCHAANVASRQTLERAGMLPCARIVRGLL